MPTYVGVKVREAPLPTVVPGLPRGRGAAAALLLVVGVVAVGAAYGILRLQVHYVQKETSGLAISRWTQLLADGSGVQTSIGPWIAAGLFFLTARRVLTRPPEPPLGPAGDPRATVSQMRRALRRELHGMRWLLLVVGLLAILDTARLVVNLGFATIRSSPVASDQLGWTAVEAGGLVAATAALTVAVLAFRRQVRDLGAV